MSSNYWWHIAVHGPDADEINVHRNQHLITLEIRSDVRNQIDMVFGSGGDADIAACRRLEECTQQIRYELERRQLEEHHEALIPPAGDGGI